MDLIQNNIDKLDDGAIARYTLTRFILLYSLSRIIQRDPWAAEQIKAPQTLMEDGALKSKFLASIEDLIVRLIVDLKFEIQKERQENVDYDYKSAFKSPAQVEKLSTALEQSYVRDVERGREKMIRESIAERS
jgi:hypothetical protein